jgi:hypothetical protein
MGSSDYRWEPLAGNAQEHTYSSEEETGNQLPSSVDVLSVGPLPEQVGLGLEADNDILAAVTAVTPDTLMSIELALDQLTTTTDLFDIPVVDFDDSTGT